MLFASYNLWLKLQALSDYIRCQPWLGNCYFRIAQLDIVNTKQLSPWSSSVKGSIANHVKHGRWRLTDGWVVNGQAQGVSWEQSPTTRYPEF